MRRLDYQDRVLTRLDAYLEILVKEKKNADKVSKIVAENPGVDIPVPDFTETTWEKMREAGGLPPSRSGIPFSRRRDEMERPVPNIVMKVPTGGGKTFLAVNAVSRVMGSYLSKRVGFVLWIVPNEAIYAQTLKRFRTRSDPYRQMLDAAGAGGVRIMEKGDRLDTRDVEENLCVMLLMLQSANRESKESLRMFRDRGDVHGFTPDQGDQLAHKRMLEKVPNLDRYDLAESPLMWPMIKDSLGNALRIVRPVVVLDEGHKATSQLALDTLYGFNPCFVLELTATPKDVYARGGRNPRPARYANVLVDVTGVELDREGMIKMPLHLDPLQDTDWKNTLNAALERLRDLEGEAEAFRADSNCYIRPILLVQVERTGGDQLKAGLIHAEDVKEWLLTAGFDEAEIVVKTAERNDLNQPENQDLLSPMNRVRVIITRQALQEGWDCPFAYILCALAASSNSSAMTQLVGRILRQPHAMKTGIESLDGCYVITHHASTAEVVKSVKEGLERDGLGDLVPEIVGGGDNANGGGLRRIDRREGFAKTEIHLPRVLIVDEEEVRDLDYETDVASPIDWRGFDPSTIAWGISENVRPVEGQLVVFQIKEKPEASIVHEAVASSVETMTFHPAYAVRMISDIVPNVFVGQEIVGAFVKALEKRGFSEERLGGLSGLLIEELRKGLERERGVRAERMFRRKVKDGEIQFRLRADGRNWRMPFYIDTSEPEGADQLNGADGGPLRRSLFSPVYKAELNGEERAVAVYLDKEKALSWWHRNAARSQYGLQGWKRHRIYPDFIFAQTMADDKSRFIVLETKGDYLDNLDTEYKRCLLALMSENFSWNNTLRAGELELVRENGEIVKCALVLMSEWQTNLPELLASNT